MQNHKNPVITYHPNGEVKSETNYKNRVKHGAEINWDEDGLNVTEVTWENGLKKKECKRKGSEEELVTEWRKSAQKRREGTLRNGKRHGVTVWWDEMGRKVTEMNYKNDKRHGLSTYWHEGFTIEGVYKHLEINHKHDKKHGLTVKYHESGKKKYEKGWIDDEEHGLSTWWDGDGAKEKEEYLIQDRGLACIEWNKEANVTAVDISPSLSITKLITKIKKSYQKTTRALLS